MDLDPFLVTGSRTHRVTLVLALALALSWVSPSDAQQPDCLEVKTQVASDTEEVRHLAAWRALHGCGDVEAAALATVLRRAVPKSSAENMVRYAAMSLHDARLLDSVRAIAKDATRSRDQRLWDLGLLITYISPGSMLETADTGAVGVIGVIPSDSYGTIWGDRPPQEEDIARALATMVRIGRTDRDPIIRRLAERAAEELGFSEKRCPPASLVDLPAQWLCSALKEELPR